MGFPKVERAHAQGYHPDDLTTLQQTGQCVGCNLQGVDLRGMDLTQANLANSDLSHAILDGADLTGADLSSANLRSASLRDASLRGAELNLANFQNADLTRADVNNARALGAHFGQALLNKANFANATLSGAVFAQATAKLQDPAGYEELLVNNPISNDPVGQFIAKADQLMAGLIRNNLAFTSGIPKKMTLDANQRVEARAALNAHDLDAFAALLREGSRLNPPIRLHNILEARLNGIGFRVEPDTSLVYVLQSATPLNFSWQIKAVEEGIQPLDLPFYATFVIEGASGKRQIAIIKRDVAVSETLLAALGKLALKLAAAIVSIGAAVAAVYKGWRWMTKVAG